MELRVLEKGNKKDIRVFRSVPFQIYRRHSLWVPPLPGEIERVMTPENHPFYEHSDADFIVIENGREVLGRMAVLHNRNFCEFHKQNSAFFFYFDSIDDFEVSQKLFDYAKEWAHQRHLDKIVGPRGFLRSNAPGLLVKGFDQPPAMGIQYNAPYYGNLVERNGFTKYFDLFSGYMDKLPDKLIHQVAEKVLARGRFQVKNFSSANEVIEWVPQIEKVHHEAFQKNPDYYPSTSKEFELLIHNILEVAEPNLLKLILHGDDLAGFIVAYPDLGNALRRAKGNLWPLGWLHLLVGKRFSRVVDLNGVGLLPEYQGLGGNALLYSEVAKILGASRFKKGEIIQVDERNFRSKSDMETVGVIFNKTHRVYSSSI